MTACRHFDADTRKPNVMSKTKFYESTFGVSRLLVYSRAKRDDYMSLKEQLFADLKTAMKEKDTLKKDTVQLIRSGILQFEKDNKVELDDEGVMEIITKQLKSRRDSLPDFVKSGREDLIEKLNKEIEILLSYLPEQLSEEEIAKIVEEAIAETGAASIKEMGKVMGIVNPKLKGRADMKVVGALVKKLLTGK